MSLPFGIAPSAQIVVGKSVDVLRAHAHEFNVIYLDTSHDYETVKAELIAIKAQEADHHFTVCGDDYSGQNNWGVACACDELLPYHVPLFNRIWLAEIVT